MSAYLVGNFLGRLAISYALVWLIIWLGFARLQWRQTFRHTHRWYGVLSITTVFLLGLVAAAGTTIR